MGERGLWSLEKKPEGAYRYINKDLKDKDILEKYKGKAFRGIVE